MSVATVTLEPASILFNEGVNVGKKIPEKPGPGRPPADEPKAKRVAFRLRADLERALVAYLDSLRPRPTDTSVMEVALEDFLRSKGFWSPPSR